MFVCIQLKRIFCYLLVFSTIIITSFITITQTTPAQASVHSVKLAVIMYHGLVKEKTYQNEYMIDPEYFEQDLKYLKDNGYHTIWISELIDYFENGKELPENPVLLTFDDSYYNNYTYAYPLLKKYGSKAVISPIGITADSAMTEKDKSSIYSQCSWTELKEMVNSGYVELQNHTYNLHHLDKGRKGAAAKPGELSDEYEKILTEDLTTLSNKMYQNIGVKPQAFVYPFGAKSETSLNIIKKLGYKAALDCEEKLNLLNSKDDLYTIHRFLRPNNMSSKEFFENTVDIGSTKN